MAIKLALVALVVLVAGAVVNFSPVVKSIDTAPISLIGSALNLPEKRTICLELSRELSTDWPVIEAELNWNKNGSNLFTTDFQANCDGIVLITESDTDKWWGSTEFYLRDLINVQLSTATPVNRRLAVVCHELGHVLGLPHSLGDGSCMDHNQNNPKPTRLNLSTARKDSWSAAVARNSMLGVK